MTDVLTRLQALDLCARAAYGAIQGHAIAVKAEGYQHGLGYDDLPGYGQDFVIAQVKGALEGKFLEPSGNEVTLKVEQQRARDRLFYVVARAAMRELYALGLVTELGVSDGPV